MLILLVAETAVSCRLPAWGQFLPQPRFLLRGMQHQKGETVAEDFLRGLYRDGRLTAIELTGRLRAVEALVAGKLRPCCTVRKQRTNSVVEQSEFRLRLRRRRSRNRLAFPRLVN